MAIQDWSTFKIKIYIKCDLPTLYNAWTTRRNLENWFLRKGEFKDKDGQLRADDSPIQVGDTYEWMWHGHPDSTVEHGIVTEANGKDRFQFVFGEAGLVTVQLTKYGEDVEMVLTQSQIPVTEEGKMSYHVGCSTGWTFYFANIKSLLEGGHDLRNRRLDHKGVINS